MVLLSLQHRDSIVENEKMIKQKLQISNQTERSIIYKTINFFIIFSFISISRTLGLGLNTILFCNPHRNINDDNTYSRNRSK